MGEQNEGVVPRRPSLINLAQTGRYTRSRRPLLETFVSSLDHHHATDASAKFAQEIEYYADIIWNAITST